jgi:hypothetical protein
MIEDKRVPVNELDAKYANGRPLQDQPDLSETRPVTLTFGKANWRDTDRFVTFWVKKENEPHFCSEFIETIKLGTGLGAEVLVDTWIDGDSGKVGGLNVKLKGRQDFLQQNLNQQLQVLGGLSAYAR